MSNVARFQESATQPTGSGQSSNQSQPRRSGMSPDLSHLTIEERRIIEEVLHRQHEEERKDAEVIKKSLPLQTQQLTSSQHSTTHLGLPTSSAHNGRADAAGEGGGKSLLGSSTMATLVAGAVSAVTTSTKPSIACCQVCHKTKFADSSRPGERATGGGGGRTCESCGRKFCARCGGCATIERPASSSKMVWLCKNCLESTAGATFMDSSRLHYPDDNRPSPFRHPVSSNHPRQLADNRRLLPQVTASNARRGSTSMITTSSTDHHHQLAAPWTPGRFGPVVGRYTSDRTTSLDHDRAFLPFESDYSSSQSRDRDPRFLHHTRPHHRLLPNPRLSSETTTDCSVESMPWWHQQTRSRASLQTPVYYSGGHPSDVDSSSAYDSGGHSRGQGHGSTPTRSRIDESRQLPSIHGLRRYPVSTIPHRYREQLRNHQLHNLSFSSSEDEDSCMVGLIRPGQHWLEQSEGSESSYLANPLHSYPYGDRQQRGTATDDDDPASQFFISSRPDVDRLSNPVYVAQGMSPMQGTEREGGYRKPRSDYGRIRQDPDSRSMASIGRGSDQEHRVSWTRSRDGHYLIGRIILIKHPNVISDDSGALLGLKVVGGRRNDAGQLTAFVSKVKPGSLADSIGRLQANDEVVEWNGQSLLDWTADEVADLIHRYRNHTRIQLVVRRKVARSNQAIDSDINRLHLSPQSSTPPEPTFTDNIARLQLQLFYEQMTRQLIISLLSACNLASLLQSVGFRHDDDRCNAFCTLRLLSNNEKSPRYSRLIPDNNNPKWSEEIVFSNFANKELMQSDLEIVAWHCNLLNGQQFALGEVIIDLSAADLVGNSYWYPLQPRPPTSPYLKAPTSIIEEAIKQQQSMDHTPPFRAGSRQSLDQSSQIRGRGRRRGDQQYGYNNNDDETGDCRSIASADIGLQSTRHPTPSTSSSQTTGSQARMLSIENRRLRIDEQSLGHSDQSEFSDMSEVSRSSQRADRRRLKPVSSQHPSISDRDRSDRKRRERSRPLDDDQISVGSMPRLDSEPGRVSSESGGATSSSSRPPGGQSKWSTGKHRTSIGHRFSTVLGRSHKSNSTTNLDKKTKSSFQRSEEVLPVGRRDSHLSNLDESVSSHRTGLRQQLSTRSEQIETTSRSDQFDHDSPILNRNESHLGEFVEGLGPGQLVGRQVLGMPCLGEIQLSFLDRKSRLEVEVIRARGLQHKNTSKPLPAPYVKLHLLEGKQSVEKLRANPPSRRTLDPLYQQQLTFSLPYHGKILQISIWGEYGRMEKKVFLGMCEVVLDDLDLKSVVFGWYKLFGMIASSTHQHHHSQPHHTQHQLMRPPNAVEGGGGGRKGQQRKGIGLPFGQKPAEHRS